MHLKTQTQEHWYNKTKEILCKLCQDTWIYSIKFFFCCIRMDLLVNTTLKNPFYFHFALQLAEFIFHLMTKFLFHAVFFIFISNIQNDTYVFAISLVIQKLSTHSRCCFKNKNTFFFIHFLITSTLAVRVRLHCRV